MQEKQEKITRAIVKTFTTGLNPKSNSIWRIAVIIFDKDMNTLSELDLEFEPHPLAVIDSKALTVLGIDSTHFAGLNPFKVGVEMFINYIAEKTAEFGKIQIFGHFPEHEVSFLKKLFDIAKKEKITESSFDDFFFNKPICIACLFSAMKDFQNYFEPLNLKYIAANCGVENDLHFSSRHKVIFEVLKTLKFGSI